MKNNQLTFILVGVLFLSTLGTTMLYFKFSSIMWRSRDVQVKLLTLNNTYSFMNQLLADCTEYAKKDPGIEPLLQSVVTTPANSSVMLPPKPPAK